MRRTNFDGRPAEVDPTALSIRRTRRPVRGGGSLRSTRQASAPPKSLESVMQDDLPDGVVNATSSPSCVVVPSRVAEWYWPTSAGRPASMKAITSPTGAPSAGGLAGVVGVGDVVRGIDLVVLAGADREGSACSAFPSTPCEQPPTSTDAAMSTAIRIPARLAGRQAIAGKARRDAARRVCSIPSVHARTRRPRNHRLRHASRDSPATACTGGGPFRTPSRRWVALRFQAPRPVQPWPGVRYCHGFAQLRSAAAHVHGAGGRQVPADGRGLPDAERHHAEEAPRRTDAGHGVHPRRRLHPRQLGNADLRRRSAGAQGLCLRIGELPARRARLPRPVVPVDPRHHHRRQPVPAGPGDGAALGARQHRRLRW